MNLPPERRKSYPFLRQRDLQWKDSCPEKLYLLKVYVTIQLVITKRLPQFVKRNPRKQNMGRDAHDAVLGITVTNGKSRPCIAWAFATCSRS